MPAVSLPDILDLRKLVNQRKTINGCIDLCQLPRLADYASDAERQVDVSLRFFCDEENRYRIQGTADTQLVMTCQRCLGPLEEHVTANIDLVLVWSEDQAKQLSLEQEAWISDGEPIKTATLLEEEIILALPLVATHEDCEPPATNQTPPVETPKAQQDNPFSVLAKLKKRQE